MNAVVPSALRGPGALHEVDAIDALLLDCGNTLIRPLGGVGTRYAAVAARYGVHAPVQDVTDRFHALFGQARATARARGVLAYGRSEPDARAFWHSIVHETFSPWCEPGTRRDAVFADLYDHFADADAWEVFDDTLPLIDAARAAGVPVAIVSNWDARLPELVASLGLDRRVDLVVASFEVGAEKPDPHIFDVALKRLGVAPGPRVLHIGDSLSEDVAGARAAGLLALHLDRTARHPDDAGRIRTLSEVAAWLTNSTEYTPVCPKP